VIPNLTRHIVGSNSFVISLASELIVVLLFSELMSLRIETISEISGLSFGSNSQHPII
jgi:hypothetical protein